MAKHLRSKIYDPSIKVFGKLAWICVILALAVVTLLAYAFMTHIIEWGEI